MFKHIIFDCDGVLVDSEALSMQLDVAILAEHGVAMSVAEAHRRFVGKTFAAMIAEVEAETGTRFPTSASAEKDRRLLDLYATQLRAVPGVHEALTAINRAPYSCASNSPAERVRVALAITGLEPFFGSRIVSFEDVKHGKPAPDVFIETARRMSVAPQECLVVEDSVTGVTAAVRAGCTVLGFTGTWAHPEEHGMKLKAAGARAIFAEMADLPGLVTAAS
ncbi:HAD family hydrolase [Aestuariivirga sp.]|uniref:HAD family hydrolase n=1 Tax=Aestuariivirga sp. TaxID=2650926 RepID=UPI0039E60980